VQEWLKGSSDVEFAKVFALSTVILGQKVTRTKHSCVTNERTNKQTNK